MHAANWVGRLWGEFVNDPWQPKFVIPLVIINFLGLLYGFYWYRNQLAVTPFYLWPLVADSPVSVVFFTAALIFQLAGRRNVFLTVLGSASVIKYGIWAAAVIGHFWLLRGGIDFVVFMIMVSHLGMALEGVIYLRRVACTVFAAAAAFAWLLLNDAVDYLGGIHPYLYFSGQFDFAMYAALALTFLVTVLIKGCLSQGGEKV